jgi:predicted DNA-binding protein (MmcQ/YjbR family)
MDAANRARALCLALPQAEERETWGQPTFRVRDRIFAMLSGQEGLALVMKAPPGAQEMLTAAAPERVFRPAYVGQKGWIGLRLSDATDWDEAAAFVRRSWAMTAPKRLAATLDAATHAGAGPV